MYLSAAREARMGAGGYSEHLQRVLRMRGVTLLGLLCELAGMYQEWRDA